MGIRFAFRMTAICMTLATVWSGPLQGQTTEGCQFVLDSVLGSGRRIENERGRIRQVAWGGVFWNCSRPGRRADVLWRGSSDSVSRSIYLARADFVGAVRFRDSTIELHADRATYYERDDRLEAFGNVRLVNHKTGSVLTGPRLTYWREVPGIRDSAELFAPRRPTVEYRSEGDTTEPYIIVAERVRLLGASVAIAAGDVTIDRSDFSSKGDSALLDLGNEHGYLVGNAEAHGKDSVGYSLKGRRIVYRLEGSDLTWVQAQQEAEAESADWHIVGDTVEFALEESKIQAAAAWGDSIRPRATSDFYTLTADSLAVDTPNQVLSEMRAFGNAIATANTDTAAVGSASLDSVRTEIETDWMAGDTVVAQFADTEDGRRTLVVLSAAGNARAFYHVYDEDDPTLAPALNYSRGLRIVALFKDDTLDRVDVFGQADGVYLEPRRPGS